MKTVFFSQTGIVGLLELQRQDFNSIHKSGCNENHPPRRQNSELDGVRTIDRAFHTQASIMNPLEHTQTNNE